MVESRPEDGIDEDVLKPNKRTLIDRLLMRPPEGTNEEFNEKESDKGIYRTEEPTHLRDNTQEGEGKQLRFRRESLYALFGKRTNIDVSDKIEKYTDTIPSSLHESRLDRLKKKITKKEHDSVIKTLNENSSENSVASVNKNTLAAHNAAKAMLDVDAAGASTRLGYAQAETADRTYRFLRTTASAYMTRSLALKYQGVFQMRDLIRSTVRIGRILEAKLEAIKLNTGATELDKRSIGSVITDNINQKTAEFITNQSQNIAKRFALDPAKNFATKNITPHITPKIDELSERDDLVGSFFQKVKGTYTDDESDISDPKSDASYTDASLKSDNPPEGTSKIIDLLTQIRDILKGNAPSSGTSGESPDLPVSPAPLPKSPSSGPGGYQASQHMSDDNIEDAIIEDMPGLPKPHRKSSVPDTPARRSSTDIQDTSAESTSTVENIVSKAHEKRTPAISPSEMVQKASDTASYLPIDQNQFTQQISASSGLPQQYTPSLPADDTAEESSLNLPAVQDNIPPEEKPLVRNDLETIVGERIDKIHDLIDGFFNRRDDKADSKYLDRDRDNIRDNSYRDFIQDNKENAAFGAKALPALMSQSESDGVAPRTYGSFAESDKDGDDGIGFWEAAGAAGGATGTYQAAKSVINRYRNRKNDDSETSNDKRSNDDRKTKKKSSGRLKRALRAARSKKGRYAAGGAFLLALLASSGDKAEAADPNVSLDGSGDKAMPPSGQIAPEKGVDFRDQVIKAQSQSTSQSEPLKRQIAPKKDIDFRDQVIKNTSVPGIGSSKTTPEDTPQSIDDTDIFDESGSVIPSLLAGGTAGLGVAAMGRQKRASTTPPQTDIEPDTQPRKRKTGVSDRIKKTLAGPARKAAVTGRAGNVFKESVRFGKSAIGPLSTATDIASAYYLMQDGDYRSAALQGMAAAVDKIPYFGLPLSMAISGAVFHRRTNISRDKDIIEKEGPLFKARMKLYGVPGVYGSARGPIEATSELERKLHQHFASENDFMMDEDAYKDCIKHLGLRASNPNEFDYALKWARERVQMIFMTYLRILEYARTSIPGFESIAYTNETDMSEAQATYIIRELTKQTNDIVRKYKDVIPTRVGFDRKYGSQTSLPGGDQGGKVDMTENLISELDAHIQSIKPLKRDDDSYNQLKDDQELEAKLGDVTSSKDTKLKDVSKERKDLLKKIDPDDVSGSITELARKSGVATAGFMGSSPAEESKTQPESTEKDDEQGRRIIGPKKGVDFRDQVHKGSMLPSFGGSSEIPLKDTKQYDDQDRRIITPKKGVDFRDQVYKGSTTSSSRRSSDTSSQGRSVQYDDQGRPIIRMTSDTSLKDLRDTVTSVAADQRPKERSRPTSTSRRESTQRPTRPPLDTYGEGRSFYISNPQNPWLNFGPAGYVYNQLTPKKVSKNILFGTRYELYGVRNDAPRMRRHVDLLEQDLYETLRHNKPLTDEKIIRKHAKAFGVDDDGDRFNQFVQWIHRRVQPIFAKYLGLLKYFRENSPGFGDISYTNEKDISRTQMQTLAIHLRRNVEDIVQKYGHLTPIRTRYPNDPRYRDDHRIPRQAEDILSMGDGDRAQHTPDDTGRVEGQSPQDASPPTPKPSLDKDHSIRTAGYDGIPGDRPEESSMPARKDMFQDTFEKGMLIPTPKKPAQDNVNTDRPPLGDIGEDGRDYYITKPKDRRFNFGPAGALYNAFSSDEKSSDPIFDIPKNRHLNIGPVGTLYNSFASDRKSSNPIFDVRYEMYGLDDDSPQMRRNIDKLEREMYKNLRRGKPLSDPKVIRKHAKALGIKDHGKQFQLFYKWVRERVQLLFSKYLGLVKYFRENSPGFEDISYANEQEMPLTQMKTLAIHFQRDANNLQRQYRDIKFPKHTITKEFFPRTNPIYSEYGNKQISDDDIINAPSDIQKQAEAISRQKASDDDTLKASPPEKPDTSTIEQQTRRHTTISSSDEEKRRHVEQFIRESQQGRRSPDRDTVDDGPTEDYKTVYGYVKPETVDIAQKSRRTSGDSIRRTPAQQQIAKRRTDRSPRREPDTDLGAMSAQYESSENGSMAIGYDRTGGTSYGKYQLASKPGTFSRFIDWVSKQPDPGPEIAKRLKDAGPANTGRSTGRVPSEWKRIVQEGLIGDFETKFIKKTHYDVALKKLPPILRTEVRQSKALRDILWSTSVQHGPGAAKSIFATTHKDAPDTQAWIQNIYDKRRTQFSSSTAAVQDAVDNRFDHELKTALDTHQASREQRVASRSPDQPSPSTPDTSLPDSDPSETSPQRTQQARRPTSSQAVREDDIMPVSHDDAPTERTAPRVQRAVQRPQDTSRDDMSDLHKDGDLGIPTDVRNAGVALPSSGNESTREVVETLMEQATISRDGFENIQALLKAIHTSLDKEPKKDDVGHNILATLKEQLSVQKEIREIRPTNNTVPVQSGQQGRPQQSRRPPHDMSVSKARPQST